MCRGMHMQLHASYAEAWLCEHRVLQNLRKNKDIVITKPDKGNGVVMLDWKLYNNTIQKIIADTSKFKKLNEDHTILHKLKQKNFFYKNEYNKLHSGSAPAHI